MLLISLRFHKRRRAILVQLTTLVLREVVAVGDCAIS